MNHLTKEYVTNLKDSLLFINAFVIIYHASLFLLSTKYISVHYYARDFLNKVSYITRTPQNIFFESIFLFIIIVLLMKLREKDNLKMANGLVYIEIILSFLLIIRLNGSYNGILLFVFADLLYNMRNIKHMALLLLMVFGLLLISDYNILCEPKRLVYAYDELQNLNLQSLPSPEELFGTNNEGTPNVRFNYEPDGTSKQDIILEK